MDSAPVQDGIHAMVPRDKMEPAARLLRDTYAITPGLPFLKQEFGYYSLDAWAEQGLPPTPISPSCSISIRRPSTR